MSAKTKKTFYINSEIVKSIKIKSAIDEKTETDVVNCILSDYFKGRGKQYSFPRKKEDI